MPFINRCPHCESKLRIPNKKAKELIRCPKCQIRFFPKRVPDDVTDWALPVTESDTEEPIEAIPVEEPEAIPAQNAPGLESCQLMALVPIQPPQPPQPPSAPSQATTQQPRTIPKPISYGPYQCANCGWVYRGFQTIPCEPGYWRCERCNMCWRRPWPEFLLATGLQWVVRMAILLAFAWVIGTLLRLFGR
jgi:hypothetical protein